MENEICYGERVDELLKVNNLKRQALADYLGINVATICKWIKFRIVPNADIIYRTAEFLKTSVDYLVTGKEKDPLPDDIQEVVKALSQLSEKDRRPIVISVIAQIKAIKELIGETNNETAAGTA